MADRTTIDQYDDGYVIGYTDAEGSYQKVVKTKGELRALLMEIFSDE